jgi:hypothetical protein
MRSGKLRKEGDMHLHRVTPDAFENYNMPVGGKYLGQSHDYFKCSNSKPVVVVARFERFGGGEHRKSDYEVLSEWQDVEDLIAKFAKRAIRLLWRFEKQRNWQRLLRKSVGNHRPIKFQTETLPISRQ